MTDREVKVDHPPKVHRVRIVLRHIEPAIWRIIETPTDIPLQNLHYAIQSAMGWGQAHLYSFERAGKTYTDTSFGGGRPDDIDAADVTLAEALGEGGRFLLYTYDFGDSWRHGIWLEEPVDPVPGRAYPRLVDGARACPPEDCGGVPGYQRLLRVLRGEVDDPHLRDWIPEDFDPENLDATPRPVGPTRTYQWDQPDSGNAADSTDAEINEHLRRLIDENDAVDEEVAGRLTDPLDRSLDHFRAISWALHEVSHSRDGLSPRVREIARDTVDTEFELPDRLLDALSDRELLEMGHPAPLNAADLLGELQYEPAIEPLIDTLTYVDDVESPLAQVTVAALIEFGEAAVEPLLDAYVDAASRRERQLILAALAYMEFDDERIEERLVESFDELSKDYLEPAHFAALYGGVRIQQALEERFEAVAAEALEPERRRRARRRNIETKRLTETVEYALFLFEKLEKAGHEPTDHQNTLADQLEDLQMSLMRPRDFFGGSSEPYQARETPGRNDPCWCGSGKKYKKCHLRKDQA